MNKKGNNARVARSCRLPVASCQYPAAGCFASGKQLRQRGTARALPAQRYIFAAQKCDIRLRRAIYFAAAKCDIFRLRGMLRKTLRVLILNMPLSVQQTSAARHTVLPAASAADSGSITYRSRPGRRDAAPYEKPPQACKKPPPMAAERF